MLNDALTVCFVPWKQIVAPFIEWKSSPSYLAQVPSFITQMLESPVSHNLPSNSSKLSNVLHSFGNEISLNVSFDK